MRADPMPTPMAAPEVPTGAILSHMEIGVRELRNHTADVIKRVRHSGSMALTVNRQAVA